MKLTTEQRFWAKVQKTDTCWLWTAAKNESGYGIFWNVELGRLERAHRYSWRLVHGIVPELPLMLLHSCDVPACINPAHLRIGTAKENAADCHARQRARGQFKAGHFQSPKKLTAVQVLEIRIQRAYGVTQRKVAARFGVDQALVSAIHRRKIWREI